MRRELKIAQGHGRRGVHVHASSRGVSPQNQGTADAAAHMSDIGLRHQASRRISVGKNEKNRKRVIYEQAIRVAVWGRGVKRIREGVVTYFTANPACIAARLCADCALWLCDRCTLGHCSRNGLMIYDGICVGGSCIETGWAARMARDKKQDESREYNSCEVRRERR